MKFTLINKIKRFLNKSPFSEHWSSSARNDIEAWYIELQKNTNSQQAVDTAARLLIGAARLGFANHENKLSIFRKAEEFGVHFLPTHFYSPVPETNKIPEHVFDQRYDDLPNLTINFNEIAELLSELAEYSNELSDVSVEPKPGEYYWNNSAFGGGDASLLYAMIRKYKPRKVYEIGSGYSTLIGLKALKKNGTGKYLCIEPYPNEDIKNASDAGHIELLDKQIQEISLSKFEELEENDILFIDSSHVCKTGSDVIYEFLKIIPRLRPGVLIHVHDIFFPFEYPKSWVLEKQIFWNEGYLLMAFLAYNNAYKTLIPNQICGVDLNLREKFNNTFPFSPVAGGGSYWFRKVAGNSPISSPH